MERKRQIDSPEYLLSSLVVSLVRQQPASSITLQAYLENLRWLAWRWSDRQALKFDEFVELLCLAFVPMAAVEDASGAPTDGFLEWDQCVTDQLHELAERQWAMDALEPCDYLESALVGGFAARADNDDPAKLQAITWEEFADLLSAGRRYENSASRLGLAADGERCRT